MPELRKFNIKTKQNTGVKKTMLCQLVYPYIKKKHYSQKEVEDIMNEMIQSLLKEKKRNKSNQEIWISLAISTDEGFIPTRKIYITDKKHVSFNSMLFKSYEGINDLISEKLINNENFIKSFNININKVPKIK